MQDFINHPSIKIIAEKTEPWIISILERLSVVTTSLRATFIVTRYFRTAYLYYFISNRQWAAVWKSSNIVSVFKKESGTDKTCYRPVSVLTALSFTGGSHQIYLAI